MAFEINSARLKRGGVLLQEGAGGYVCLGLGSGAALARFAFEDAGETPYFDRCREATTALDGRDLAKAERLGLLQPVSLRGDPALRRLAVADALHKAGFDPDQPRDDDGRWTDTGGSSGEGRDDTSIAPGVAGAAAGLSKEPWQAARTAGSLISRVTPVVIEGLKRIAGALLEPAAAGPATFFGLALIPFNRSLISDGSLPDRPDVQYHFDRGTGVLQLGRDGQEIFSGQAGADGIFSTEDGTEIARRHDDALVVDPAAVLEAEASRARGKRPKASARRGVAETEDNDRATLDPEAAPASSRDEPEVCPKPVQDRKGSRYNFNGVMYEAYIHWKTNPDRPIDVGKAVRNWDPVKGEWVYYDDCRRVDVVYIEAKAGYEFMLRAGSEGTLIDVVDRWREQARRQIRAAQGHPVEWHFSNEKVAEFAKRWFAWEFQEISVHYTPLPKEWQQ